MLDWQPFLDKNLLKIYLFDIYDAFPRFIVFSSLFSIGVICSKDL
jgi:hypothetical protein